jgi:type III pantothenate kinase
LKKSFQKRIINIFVTKFYAVQSVIAVDIGNTFVKVAVFKGEKMLEQHSFSLEESRSFFEKLLQKYPEIRRGILSSVVEIPAWILVVFSSIHLHILSYESKLPFEIAYHTPQTLGCDRIALVAFASEQFPKKNVLVIDMGTCITYDFLQADNVYVGGSISPGIQMRLKALNTFTAKLPLVKPSENPELIGNSTTTSIQSGVINGVLAELKGIIAAYNAIYEDLTVFISGGDNKYFDKQLKNSIFATANPVLEGLRVILNYNEIQ